MSIPKELQPLPPQPGGYVLLGPGVLMNNEIGFALRPRLRSQFDGAIINSIDFDLLVTRSALEWRVMMDMAERRRP